MSKELWWWTVVAVTVFSLIGLSVVTSRGEIAASESCKKGRIRPFVAEFFYWDGMLKLNQDQQYQPGCL